MVVVAEGVGRGSKVSPKLAPALFVVAALFVLKFVAAAVLLALASWGDS